MISKGKWQLRNQKTNLYFLQHIGIIGYFELNDNPSLSNTEKGRAYGSSFFCPYVTYAEEAVYLQDRLPQQKRFFNVKTIKMFTSQAVRHQQESNPLQKQSMKSAGR